MTNIAEQQPTHLVRTDTSPDGVAVAAVVGVVDMASYQELASALGALAESRPTGLVLDLRGVAFLGSIGIAVLVNTQHAARRLGVAFAVVADNRSVLRPLLAARVEQVLPVHPGLDEALAAVRLATT
ncbi:STAS domain-containing protein [Saccharothrix variisporea]|uniref:Anti-sigma-factor antagonist n=1 Tax=Saccharothrix variisporea TaxID=543527 RepID=A0A495X1D3_9PSEU|nr:STAS domain-containing protein [Saccharothrix variisporea]RKT67772.1 anti-sigma-factor antagonist [Saccharothrix variisporea]